jgi:hypothetical protein
MRVGEVRGQLLGLAALQVDPVRLTNARHLQPSNFGSYAHPPRHILGSGSSATPTQRIGSMGGLSTSRR